MPESITPSVRYNNVSVEKSGGVTYTPKVLANFVAGEIAECLPESAERPIRLLDPATGDGELLVAMLRCLDRSAEVHGFETDPAAIAVAKARIKAEFPNTLVDIRQRDFLEYVFDEHSSGLFSTAETYDVIIANPPYVRTQVLGADKAKGLASRFGLTGRVDLYHAFLLAMTSVLSPDGVAGFIVSNRFMTTKSGASVRKGLKDQLALRKVVDLGDTKLFDAAVLPAVIIASGKAPSAEPSLFWSIYETDAVAQDGVQDALSALQNEGVWSLPDGRSFQVIHGDLDVGSASKDIWRLTSFNVQQWLTTVHEHCWGVFRDIGKVRVGVKTCADKVFIPKEWQGELELQRPLTTHHKAKRFRSPKTVRKILYPHHVVNGKKAAVDISKYPLSAAYLEDHRDTLEARTYVIEAGRNWFEIWVPQDPDAWSEPKLIFRDIAAQPTFWMDLDQTVVNGDCYWLTGREDLLWLALAVANSTFIEKFYDLSFNNKLYSGRRRFITQYVEQFPLPDPKGELGQLIAEKTQKLYQVLGQDQVEIAKSLEDEVDRLVWAAFGVSVEK